MLLVTEKAKQSVFALRLDCKIKSHGSCAADSFVVLTREY